MRRFRVKLRFLHPRIPIMSLLSGLALREGFTALRANPLRTLLSTLGVVMGVASLTAVLSLGDGVEDFARQQIESGTDLQTLVVRPSTYRVIDGIRVPRDTIPSWTVADAESLARELGGVSELMLMMDGQALITRGDTMRARGAMVTARMAWSDPGKLAAGRDFTSDEVREDAPVVVIDHSLARALAKATRVRSDGVRRNVRASRFMARRYLFFAQALTGAPSLCR